MKGVVSYVTACHGYSERRACSLTRQHRSTQRKPSIQDPRTEIRQRMHEIVRTRIRYGYRRVHVMLRREGWESRQEPDLPALSRRKPGSPQQATTTTQDGGASRSPMTS
jgi:transposase InsO family protein